MSLRDIDFCEESGVPRSQCVGCQSVAASCPESGDPASGATAGALALSSRGHHRVGLGGRSASVVAGAGRLVGPSEIERERRHDMRHDLERGWCDCEDEL